MTKIQRVKALWQRIDIFVLSVCVMLLSAAGGAGVMNWFNQSERMQLINRFPAVRSEERAACVREFQGKIDDLTQLNKQSTQELSDLRGTMKDTHDIAAYTLRFLGDRARLNDERSAAVLKQARETTQAAVAAQQSAAQVDQKVNVVVTKADEAASAAQAVSKKLDTAVPTIHPALPAKPWAGFPH